MHDLSLLVLIFSLFKTVFSLLFSFSIYKVADVIEIFRFLLKSLNISIRTVMKNPEMLIFVLDHLKLHFEKLPYLLRYVPDNYKTQQMCNYIKNGGTLKSVSDCYKNQEFFFSIYTIYTFSNKKFTVTRYLYIQTYLESQSESHYKIDRQVVEEQLDV